MISIQYIRENVAAVKANMAKKGRSDTSIVDEVLSIDEQYRKLLFEEQQVRSLRNKYSQEVNELKKQGKDVTEKLAQLKEVPQKVKELEEQTSQLELKRNTLLQKIPNMLHDSVPTGKDDSENISVQKIGEPRNFGFEPLAHQDIAAKLGCFDPDAAAEVSGSGFYYMQGGLALLNQALIRFAIETMVSHGFTYVETPLMIKSNVVKNVVDLGDQENQIYKVEGEDLFLIGTSEHSLIGRYVQKTLVPSQLPLTHTSYSMCFRKEKGSHGLDERGLFRTHQFNKVEMVVICRPEDSMEWYKKLQNITIEIFTKLELPIQVLQICSGDIGDLKHVQVDIECWSPRRKKYIEVGSCSNLTDAQSLLLGIRVNGEGEKFIPHTLNNTAIATSRALVSILENNQTKEGTVKIPTVLQKYMFGMMELKPDK
jgi:seryl-tRNA synthetase